ncbi:hypothetical protein Tco_0622406 [Tanacetum coccineum]
MDSLWDHPLTRPPDPPLDRNRQCSPEIGLWVNQQQHKADPQWEPPHQIGLSTRSTLVLARNLKRAVPALAPRSAYQETIGNAISSFLSSLSSQILDTAYPILMDTAY